MSGYVGDLAATQRIVELFAVDKSARNVPWIEEFLQLVPVASFASSEPQGLIGPDGFPYFILKLPTPGTEFECFVLQHLRHHLLEHGLGVVIEPTDHDAQWVFSHGDIVEFHQKGFFSLESEVQQAEGGREILADAEEVLIGQPSEEFLPAALRGTLRRFFESCGVSAVGVLLMSRANQDVSQNLVFDLRAEQVGGEQNLHAILTRVGWFLPHQYRWLSLPNAESMQSHFRPL